MTPGGTALLSALLPHLYPGAPPAALGAGLASLADHSDLAAVAAATACALAGDSPRRMARYRLAHPILVTGPAAGRTAGPPATPAQKARYADSARRRMTRTAHQPDDPTPTDRKDTHR